MRFEKCTYVPTRCKTKSSLLWEVWERTKQTLEMPSLPTMYYSWRVEHHSPLAGQVIAPINWAHFVDWLHSHCVKFYATADGNAAVVFASPKEHGDVNKLVRRALEKHVPGNATALTVSVQRHSEESVLLGAAQTFATELREVRKLSSEHQLVKGWTMKTILEDHVPSDSVLVNLNTMFDAARRVHSVLGRTGTPTSTVMRAHVAGAEQTLLLAISNFQTNQHIALATKWNWKLVLNGWVRRLVVTGLPPDTEVVLQLEGYNACRSTGGVIYMAEAVGQTWATEHDKRVAENAALLTRAFSIDIMRVAINTSVVNNMSLRPVRPTEDGGWENISYLAHVVPQQMQLQAETLRPVWSMWDCKNMDVAQVAAVITDSKTVLLECPTLPADTVVGSLH